MDIAVNENDKEGNGAATDHFRPSVVALILPTVLIALGYGALWLWLYFSGREDTALARICMFVLLLGVPLLVAYCLLRFATLGIKIYNKHLRVHSGFPSRDPVDIPFAFVESAQIEYGLVGRLTGAGSIKINLSAGRPIAVAGLKDPIQVKSRIDEVCLKLFSEELSSDA